MGRDRHLHLRLRADPSPTGEVRRAIDEMAPRYGLSEEDRFDVKLAVTEAVTNALKRTPEPYPVDVILAADTEALEVEVVDRGALTPFQATALQRGHDAESGRGVALMLALMDNVEFERSENGTRVRLRKHLRQGPELRLAG